MLSKTESKVMGVLFTECKEKTSLLITPVDLIRIIGDKTLNQKRLEKIMKDLFMDGYFDLVYSDRHGETVYCVTLTEKGKGYMRKKMVMRRNIIFRICFTVGLALLSFVTGLILKAVF